MATARIAMIGDMGAALAPPAHSALKGTGSLRKQPLFEKSGAKNFLLRWATGVEPARAQGDKKLLFVHKK
jgi:hypothetical protein